MKYEVFQAAVRWVLCYNAQDKQNTDQNAGFQRHQVAEQVFKYFVKRLFSSILETPLITISVFTLGLHAKYQVKMLGMAEQRSPKVVAREVVRWGYTGAGR